MTDQYDLQFFENRSTPQVLKNGEPPRPKNNYGKATTRRPANESELKTIQSGRWVRVDEAGNVPKSPDYKKTQYRPWLVQPVSKGMNMVSAFGVEHVSKAVDSQYRKSEREKATRQRDVARRSIVERFRSRLGGGRRGGAESLPVLEQPSKGWSGKKKALVALGGTTAVAGAGAGGYALKRSRTRDEA